MPRLNVPAPYAILFRNLTSSDRRIDDDEMRADLETLTNQLFERHRDHPHEAVAGVIGLPDDEWFAITLKNVESLDAPDGEPEVSVTAKVQPLENLPAVQDAFCEMVRESCVGGVQ